MTITSKIDGYDITIQDGSFAIDNAFIGVDWDGWSATAYGRKHASYGNMRGWTFTCFEDAVAVPWTSSIAKHLKTHVVDGAAVAFEYVNLTKYLVPNGQTVYVESVEVWYSPKMTIRYFTVTVKGA
jgi:hypothetical protein